MPESNNQVFKKNNKGFTIDATIYENDNVTPKNLTNITCTYQLKNRADATTKTIVGNITDAANGKVSFSVPNAFFDVVAVYNGEINLTGSNYEEDTETFIVTILDQQA